MESVDVIFIIFYPNEYELSLRYILNVASIFDLSWLEVCFRSQQKSPPLAAMFYIGQISLMLPLSFLSNWMLEYEIIDQITTKLREIICALNCSVYNPNYKLHWILDTGCVGGATGLTCVVRLFDFYQRH